MEDILKQQDKKRRELQREQEKQWRQAEKETSVATTPTTQDEAVDYAERTKQMMEEWNEDKANDEARLTATGNAGVNDVEFIKYNTSYRRLADFIGVDTGDLSKVASELAVIMGWALENTEGEDFVDVLSTVKDLKKQLGFQEVGVTALKKLYRYIRLDLDSQRASRDELKILRKEKELLK